MRRQKDPSTGGQANPPSKTTGSIPEKAKGKPVGAPEATTKYHTLAITQSLRSAAWQCFDAPEITEKINQGAVDLYHGLEPKNGLEAALSMLMVGVTNTSLDCMSIAARVPPQEMECRELNMRYGLKGAQVVAQLAETLERIRGKSPKNVRVGKVNVESGGQAIVGNVSTDGKKSKVAPDEASPKPGKPKAA